jgi:5'-3' exonuclease
MIALVDADITVYRCAAASENDPLEVAVDRLEHLMDKIVSATKADTVQSYITGENNFRYKVNPEYKANRRQTLDPKWRQELNEYMVVNWKAVVTDGFEADDALGMEQMKYGYYPIPNTVICSIDKDLKQIPGLHYNFVKDEWDEVSPAEGLRFFYEQLLIGDRADNIIGIDRVGPVKAKKALENSFQETDWFRQVRSMYCNDKRMLMNARCLHIWQEMGGDWVNTDLGKMLAAEVGLKIE